MKINNRQTSQKKERTCFMDEVYPKYINMDKFTLIDKQNEFSKVKLLFNLGNICKYRLKPSILNYKILFGKERSLSNTL